ncbi:MAG: TIGR04283 family arsenosugar biosynthesis glycosyltransferase [Pseudomonadota bacterium]
MDHQAPAVPLSIIVPVLNEAAGIEATLAALQAMCARGAEVIVADGGSTDATMTLATALADKVIGAPRGRASQMNAGAAAARGEILLFVHADTVLPADADLLVVDALRSGKHVWGRFDVDIAGSAPMLATIAFMMNWRSRVTGIATGDQAIFVRRDAYLAVGGFPAQPLMEDIEISHRLKRQSAPLCLKQRVITSGRRWESRGVWRTIFLMWRLRLRYWFGTGAEVLAKEYQR